MLPRIILISLFIVSFKYCALAIDYSKFFAPIINRHVAHDLGSSLQVWDIEQDSNGVLFFATQLGLVKYDGNVHTNFSLPANSRVRSLVIYNGVIYVGATDEFGYFKANNNGKLKYYSLSKQLQNKEVGAVLNTFIINDKVYFIANHKRIFSYQNGELIEFSNLPTHNFKAFKIDEKIYLFVENQDIWVTQGEKFERISIQFEHHIYYSVPYNKNKVLLGTLNNGIYIFDTENRTINVLNNELNFFLKDKNVYEVLELANGNFVITTLKSGVIIISKEGIILQKFTTNHGLLNNAGFCIFQDRHMDLWIGHETGCSQIQLDLPYTCITNDFGFDGSHRNIKIFNGKMYLATSSGIYFSEFNNEHNQLSFKQIDNNYIYGLDFCELKGASVKDDILLASCLRELIYIKTDNTFDKLIDIYGCHSIVQSKINKNKIFLGGEFGLMVIDLENKDGNLTIINSKSLPNFENPIRELVISDNDILWGRTTMNHIFSLEYIPSTNEYRKTTYNQINSKYPEIVLASITKDNEKIYITSSEGIFSCKIAEINKNSAFKKDSTLNINTKNIQNLEFDKFGNKYLTNQNKLLIKKNGTNFEFSFDEIGEPVQYVKCISNIGICLLGNKNIYLLNTDYKDSTILDYLSLLNKVRIHKFDTLLLENPTSSFNFSKQIPQDFNAIDFYYSAPYYKHSNKTTYATMLVGYDTDWTSYEKLDHRMFTNLNGGNYTFKVKAKNIHGFESSVSEFTFTIKKAWYKSALFLIVSITIIFFIVISWLIILYRAKFRKPNILSETIKSAYSRISDGQIVSHQQGLEYELEKVIEVVSNVNSAIAIVDSSGDIEWINDGYIKLYGFKLHELLLNEIPVFGKNKDAIFKEAISKWETNNTPIEYKLSKETKNGKYICVQSTLTPIYNNDGLQRLIMVDVIK